MRGPCMVEGVPKIGAYTTWVFFSQCLTNSNIWTPQFRIEPLVVHGSIWFLTLMKFGKIRAPILTLVLRDGSVVFCAMLSSFATYPKEISTYVIPFSNPTVLLAGLFVSFTANISELTQYCFPYVYLMLNCSWQWSYLSFTPSRITAAIATSAVSSYDTHHNGSLSLKLCPPKNCRIIKNMEIMGTEGEKNNNTGFEFTSFSEDSMESDYSQSSRWVLNSTTLFWGARTLFVK
jgi:hypothetical protein